jgi:hypothetical protein
MDRYVEVRRFASEKLQIGFLSTTGSDVFVKCPRNGDALGPRYQYESHEWALRDGWVVIGGRTAIPV